MKQLSKRPTNGTRSSKTPRVSDRSNRGSFFSRTIGRLSNVSQGRRTKAFAHMASTDCLSIEEIGSDGSEDDFMEANDGENTTNIDNDVQTDTFQQTKPDILNNPNSNRSIVSPRPSPSPSSRSVRGNFQDNKPKSALSVRAMNKSARRVAPDEPTNGRSPPNPEKSTTQKEKSTCTTQEERYHLSKFNLSTSSGTNQINMSTRLISLHQTNTNLKIPWFVLLPDSSSLRSWEAALALFALISCAMVPMEIGFAGVAMLHNEPSIDGFNTTMVIEPLIFSDDLWWTAVTRLTDVAFFIDIVLNFCTVSTDSLLYASVYVLPWPPDCYMSPHPFLNYLNT
jgi:hypothetical protein